MRLQLPLPERYADASADELADRIDAAKRTLGDRVFVLGHHYQRDEVMRWADARGDSFRLSVLAKERTDAEYIVFCGVHFMAESADILTGDHQAVVLPDLNAGCSMADMADLDEVTEAWETLARTTEPLQWTRIRDVMPGYRFGLRDTLSLHVTTAPAKSALLGIAPQNLLWFEERMQPPPAATNILSALSTSGDYHLPPARYALALRDGKGTIVYGEQCLSARLCFTWQRWPVGQDSAAPQ